MKVISPKGLANIKAGEVGHCVCSSGQAQALEDGFWNGVCGHQCAYGSTNKRANLTRASERTAQAAPVMAGDIPI